LSNSIPSSNITAPAPRLAIAQSMPGPRALLWKFKKVPEPVVIVVAALAGLVLYPLMVK
jgi:hypothetical protein